MATVPQKRCFACDSWKSPDAFGRNRSRLDGLAAYCKECMKAKRAANAAYHKAYNQQYYSQHSDHIKATAKSWRAVNPEKHRAKSSEWYVSNKSRARATTRIRRLVDPEQTRARDRARYLRHRNTILAVQKWRNAAKRSNGGSFTKQEWDDLCARYGNVCLACGVAGPLTIDHVLPVSMGGTGYISNIQPLCMACNRAKWNQYIDYR